MVLLDCFKSFVDEDASRRWIISNPIPYREVFIPLNKIHITNSFAKTIPSPEKIAARVAEFRSQRHFDTDIVLDEGNILVDGYSAYLVAKMFGLKGLRVKVLGDEDSGMMS